MADCNDCLHFRRLSGDTVWKRRTGCYHPDLMEQTQSDPALLAQQVPGNHIKINLRGDCAKFDGGPRRGSLISRVIAALRA